MCQDIPKNTTANGSRQQIASSVIGEEVLSCGFVTISISASGNGESREAQSGHEPQQHYDNLAAHGLGLRCLHCKYNNNVHTRKENRQESDGWGRKSYDAACCPPLWSNGSGRQVCGGRSGKGYNPYSSKKPRCTNCNGKGTIRCGICYGSCTPTAPTDSPTAPYVATLPAPLVVTAVTDAATAGYPSGAATAFRGS